MESNPLHTVVASDPASVVETAQQPESGPLCFGARLGEPEPDEPLAVVAAGPHGGGRSDVVAALLGTGTAALRVPRGSFLVVGYDQIAGGRAYVPGYRQPHEYRSEPVGAGPALARPPRRVEMTFANPLLRHFGLVDTPDTGTLGPAGNQVVLDAARRGGALLFVISAEQTLAVADLDLLTEVAASEVPTFFVVTPAATGGWSTGDQPDPSGLDPSGADPAEPGAAGQSGTAGFDPAGSGPAPAAVDPAAVTLDAHRAALLAAVPSLAGAPWFALDPAATDTAYLRRALVDWASGEGLRRASGNPPVAAGATRTVRIGAGAAESDWEDRLDRRIRTCTHRIRQDLALELANIHLRCVQEILFGAGCPGLPEVLDREVQSLSLRIVAGCDAAVAGILEEVARQVFGETPDEGVRRRLVVAVREGFADHRRARDLARVLLVTRTGGVATLIGANAVTGLASYLGAARTAVLPAVGIGLSGGCYQHWRSQGNADAAKARSWLQRALREVELELSREFGRRFEAVQLSLATVVTEAIDHGILLA
jgi:hypothetical protein